MEAAGFACKQEMLTLPGHLASVPHWEFASFHAVEVFVWMRSICRIDPVVLAVSGMERAVPADRIESSGTSWTDVPGCSNMADTVTISLQCREFSLLLEFSVLMSQEMICIS